MCGIIGYIGSKNAVPIIVNGLKKLEYRGYDSAGVAVNNNGEFCAVKKRGRLTELEQALKKTPIKGNIGIGHTRWATHGEPSDINSHPHLSEFNTIAVVHNGIIENYKELKAKLEKLGVKFSSQTDSEVVAQLAEYYKTKFGGSLLDIVSRVAQALEGSFALGIMAKDNPNTLIAIKKDNPLIIGVGKDGNFIASDVPAVLEHTKSVYYLADKEIAVIKKDSIEFFTLEKEPINKEVSLIEWDASESEKGGYQHFMLKEMLEQPKILQATIKHAKQRLSQKEVLDELDIKQYTKIVITTCGSAYNAGFVAKYVLEDLARIPVEIELASEFRYKNPIVDDKTLVILISQSGETADTIAAMREAKSKGATTLGVVNVVGSCIATESDVCIYTLAGPEIAVATTKAYSAQLVVMYLLAIKFASDLGVIDEKTIKALENDVNSIPDLVDVTIKSTIDTIAKYSALCIGYSSIFFIGRNIDYAVALEGSLKLKEISYIHSEAYAGGELKHGTISLIEDGTLVVAIASNPRLFPKIMSNVEQVMTRGAKVFSIETSLVNESDRIQHKDLFRIKTHSINELFSPSLSVIILQLFSYFVAANKGLDIDKPRNLAKSVTVE